MMIDRNKVKVLIDRYMNGETTADEERQLRHFFRTAQSLPDEWLPLRALFAYVDSEAEKSCLPAETLVNHQPPPHQEMVVGRSCGSIATTGYWTVLAR